MKPFHRRVHPSPTPSSSSGCRHETMSCVRRLFSRKPLRSQSSETVSDPFSSFIFVSIHEMATIRSLKKKKRNKNTSSFEGFDAKTTTTTTTTKKKKKKKLLLHFGDFKSQLDLDLDLPGCRGASEGRALSGT